MITQIRHQVATPRLDSKIIYSAYEFLKDNELRKRLYNYYPGLERILESDREDKPAMTEEYMKRIHANEKEVLQAKAEELQKAWSKVNDKFMNALFRLLETRLPDDLIINGYTALNPMNAYSLEDNSFTNQYLLSLQSRIEITVHETVHLAYFEKFFETFPQIDRKAHEDMSSIEHHLSEILIEPILLSSEIKRLVFVKDHEMTRYSMYKENFIGNKTIYEHFTTMFNEFQDRNRSMSDFLKEAYKEAKMHEDQILSIPFKP